MNRFIFYVRNAYRDGPWYGRAAVFCLLVLSACRSEREAVYHWQGTDESKTLILRRDDTFIFEVDAGYYLRRDTGRYVIDGDTLTLNPDKAFSSIDSLVEMDERYGGRRYMEIMQPVLQFDDQNRLTEKVYRELIFPDVTVNDTLVLAIDSTDTSYRRLLIPDSLELRTIVVRVPEERTCRPEVLFRVSLPLRDPPTNSYRIFLRSYDARSHYLAGFRWLMGGDTIYASFVDEDCTPGSTRLVKTQAGRLP